MHPWEAYQGIYLHIPFCQHKCSYCDFISYQGQDEVARTRYVKALIKEIRSCEAPLPVSRGATIYVGGGTPSLLSLEELAAIFSALKEKGYFNAPREVTLEANPGTVDEAYLRGLRALGVDRLSLGIQSLEDSELRLMGRTHTADEARHIIQLSKEAGFTRLSCDLIYGFPTQTAASIEASLTELMALGPSHISIYGLSVEPGTVLSHKLQKGLWTLPTDEETGAMYDLIMDRLAKGGYERYEISNFAKAGDESRHNLIYWHYHPYLAFGAGATGFDGRKRETNQAYLAAYERGEAPEIEILSPAVQREEMIFMNLRTVRGLSLLDYETRFGRSFELDYGPETEDLIHKGWAKREDGHFRLTPLGMQYGNLAFEAFITTDREPQK
ncbi:radical SAM family heme chaperone HemW [uncultured Acidaminococcus sp.]|jgi:oxygen-independent coproporphyrinogen-3 oxidase|uniref:radical SAM family heme chaperone HemW n=3 Tax=Acidaminococcus TaxID=904 RepID=UPI0025FB3BED|nr:radical SAM family heme chaperone HemW [uncultured Acidaminococcus sp.]